MPVFRVSIPIVVGEEIKNTWSRDIAAPSSASAYTCAFALARKSLKSNETMADPSILEVPFGQEQNVYVYR